MVNKAYQKTAGTT